MIIEALRTNGQLLGSLGPEDIKNELYVEAAL